MKIDEALTFGKYNGRTIKNIYSGDFDAVNKLLNPFISEFISHKNPFRETFKRDIFFTIKGNMIILEKENDPFIETIIPYLLDRFSVNFAPSSFDRSLISKNGISSTLISYLNLINAIGDPHYIEWLLRHTNVTISKMELNNLEKINVIILEKIVLKRIKFNTLEYSPVFSKKQFRFKPDNSLILAKYFNNQILNDY